MSLSLQQKQQVVSEVTTAIGAAHAGVLAEYRGLSVAQLTVLRSEAQAQGVWVRVVKNSLARRVVAGSEFECLTAHFTGPVIFSACNDPVAVARVMVRFAKDHDEFKITAGAMNGALIDRATIDNLAKLPSRDELLGTLAATMRAPIQKLAATLNEIPTRLVRTAAALMQAKQAADPADQPATGE